VIKIETKEIKFIDLFGGVGGFRLGLERANDNRKLLSEEKIKNIYERISNTQKRQNRFTCVAYYDIDKYAVQTYNKNFKENHKPTDIRNVRAEEIPEHDLICAGFPCQSFSIAGKRKGFEDTRGTLFYEICRLAKFHRSKMLFLENVKGLLNHDNGRTFATILESLQELGYFVEWQVLNSKNFGVPQNRERVFIIGHLGGEPRQKVFPITESGEEFNSRNAETQVASALQSPGHACGNYKGMNMIKIADFRNDEGLRMRNENISPCLSARKHSGTDISTMPPLVLPVLTPNRINKRQNGSRFKKDGEEMFTLTGQDTHGIMTSKTIRSGGRSSPHGSKQNWDSYEIDNQIRRLTPVECERLQSFPDNWTDSCSDTQRYKQMGNAVTVNVIQAIGERILEVLKNE